MSDSISNDPMELYAVVQRSAWPSRTALQRGIDRSYDPGHEGLVPDVRWLHCYVLKELDGTLGGVCVCSARSPEAIREYARRIALPIEEIVGIADTVVFSQTDRRVPSNPPDLRAVISGDRFVTHASEPARRATNPPIHRGN